ncbi:MliC family protein [Jiella sonneratiae]|uniref:MliC family protein n=1 Tax=Jiella sonneratiae TaxID=2816856 RepID=A0ABS3J315_9HYPH|nr:MliC family protein [Jiella sonneratiae]MBO0903502.1 MliC family protein [Jiella sonneratiae]
MRRVAIAVCLMASALIAATPAFAEQLNLSGRSYGGKVRSGPGAGYRQVGSTRLNERIVLIERSTRMDGYDWFLIRMPNGRTGYQWGGLMCADGEESGILTICGSQQDRQLSGLGGDAGGGQPGSGRPPARDVAYSCNEGIPLTVRYRNEGRNFVAYASHDSLPEIRLVQVPSGSGVQFQAGRNWLGGKGREVSINFDGIEDSCREIR